jgi:hypothetical protein
VITDFDLDQKTASKHAGDPINQCTFVAQFVQVVLDPTNWNPIKDFFGQLSSV